MVEGVREGKGDDPRVAEALEAIQINGRKPVVDVEDGVENSTSGPAVVFNIKPTEAARVGFGVDDLGAISTAIIEGEPATTPVILNERPYTVRVKFPEMSRASLDAMSNTMLVNSNGQTSTLGALANISELPGQTEVRR